MGKSNDDIDSITDLWDNLDSLPIFFPIGKGKDGSYKIWINPDPQHEGMWMLRVFLSKDDLEMYAKVYDKKGIRSNSCAIVTLEDYMGHNAKAPNGYKLSRCVLCSMDISNKLREIETIWHFNSY